MAINENIRLKLADEAIVFDNPSFDNAIIGQTIDGRAIYDYGKMVIELMLDDNISEQEAIDWIEYNTLRTVPYTGDMAPIVIYLFEEEIYEE